jgi:hypothetical protein
MTSYVKEIIGKTITGVITKEKRDGGSYPKSQVFLIFDDNTYYEFYCCQTEILGIKGLRQGTAEDVRKYMSPIMEIEQDYQSE